MMKDFNKEFERTERNIKRGFWAVFIINGLISLAILGGLFWLVYVLLKHFGIVG